MRVRGLYINTHVGQAVRQGGLAWALNEFHPDFTVLTELTRVDVRERVKRGFPNERYSRTGFDPEDRWVAKSGTVILAKRRVLKIKWRENTLMTPQRFLPDGTRDKWHPVRRKTRARFVFRERPEVDFEIGADHTWTYAGHQIDGSHEVPREHRKQVRSYAGSMLAASAEHRACVDIGDMNERVPTGDGDNYVIRNFERVGARVLVARHLDYVFGNEQVSLEDAKILPAAKVRTDHPGIVVDLKVRD